MITISFGLACPRSNALRKKLVREHHEVNIGLERHIESVIGYEKNEHKAEASSSG